MMLLPVWLPGTMFLLGGLPWWGGFVGSASGGVCLPPGGVCIQKRVYIQGLCLQGSLPVGGAGLPTGIWAAATTAE